MANPSKAKGTAAETAVVKWARVNGFPGADRQPLRGNRDAGDIGLCPGIVVEVKSSRLAATGQPPAALLARWFTQAEVECRNAEAVYCPLIVKRSGTADVGRWFAYLTLGDLADLLGWDATETGHAWCSPVCMSVGDLTHLIRTAGYGSEVAL